MTSACSTGPSSSALAVEPRRPDLRGSGSVLPKLGSPGSSFEAAEREPTIDADMALPRSYLRACLLLLVDEAPAHGYDLGRQLVALGLCRADGGGVYRALRSMEQDRLVSSSWERSELGPARRVYRLTVEGAEHLEAGAGAVGDAHRYLSAYLARYTAGTSVQLQ